MNYKNNVLILGSKEYPMGSNKGEDPISSGGMETAIDNLAPELAKKSKVTIITRKFSSTPWHEKGAPEVYRVPWLKGKYTRTPSFIFFSTLLILYLLLKRKVDIIYAQGVIASFASFFPAKLFRKALVCRPHGSGAAQWFFPINQIMRLAGKFVFSRCDMVIFNSEEEKKNLSENLGMEFNSYEVMMTSVPLPETQGKDLKEELGLGEELVIGFIGRLHPVKGLDYLIDAAGRVEGGFRLIIVGEGPERERLEKEVKEKGIEDRVLFLGFRSDVVDVLASIDIFVLPSLSEGLPMALLEAMGQAKACVVTDIGLPVEDWKTGLVVEKESSRELAQALQRLVEDEELRRELGLGAKDFIKENCSVEREVEGHVKVFQELTRG